MSSLIIEVCQIDAVEHHFNADKLDIIQVKGWNCIVGRDQYKAGDPVVYVPPDSVLPDALIEKYNLTYLKNGGRVGRVKLRGCLSEGLILDPPIGSKVGDDVAAMLGITKWEPPAPNYQLSGWQGCKSTRKRPNPFFDKYTDIENIKNYHHVFSVGDEVVITEKVHGSNLRTGTLPRNDKGLLNKIKAWLFGQYEFVYGSHNVQITSFTRKGHSYTDDVYGQIAARYKLSGLIPPGYTLYGEIYGKGIQDLTYGLDGIDVVFFDVKHGDRYLPYDELRCFCAERELPIVPVIYVGPLKDGQIKDLTSGKSFLCPSQLREGCVVKDLHERAHPHIGRKILKSINVDYLLRKEGTEYK